MNVPVAEPAGTQPSARGSDPTTRVELSRWADGSSGPLHARCWPGPAGGAPVGLVFVHGLGVGSRMCQPVARRLASAYPVYALDLAGFGHSTGGPVLTIEEHADELADWIRSMEIERPVVVGVSVGSQVAAAVAERHPRTCCGVVLASPTVDAARRTWLGQLPRWQLEQATQSMRMRAIQVADYARAGVGRVAQTFAHALADRPEDRLPGVALPVLVCWGTRDPLVSRRWAARLAELAPSGRLAVVPGGLHALSHESPLELARVVDRFVGRHIAGAAEHTLPRAEPEAG